MQKVFYIFKIEDSSVMRAIGDLTIKGAGLSAHL